MFANFMINAWEAGTIVAVLAGVVGFFVVLRGRAFPAHAIPNGAFAGAAGASLVGVDPLVGLVSFAVLSAFGISSMTRRSRSDVATALWLVGMLALGSAFLSLTTDYSASLNELLFGEILGVSSQKVVITLIVAVATLIAIAMIYRPLLLSSTSVQLAEGHGINDARVELAFLLVLALAAALTVPVAGALLTFSLMISPAAAASLIATRPSGAIGWSVGLAVVIIWSAIASSYLWSYPVGFFVGTYGLVVYVGARLVRAGTLRRVQPSNRPR